MLVNQGARVTTVFFNEALKVVIEIHNSVFITFSFR